MTTWLTLPEAARRLHVSIRTLRRQWQAGRLPPPVRVGRRRLYDAATLDAAIAGADPARQDPIMAAILNGTRDGTRARRAAPQLPAFGTAPLRPGSQR